ncbi:MAG TPA: hypothetical protein VM487_00925 [Phycisphaerae bacterium]|nr:hypothetical protein [Phycisphaerae bacterium]
MEATETQPELRLNMGAGNVPVPGFTAIDRKRGIEVYPLPQFTDSSVAEIRASHILEHFTGAQALDVMDEWVRVLKPGGRIRVAVPNFDWVCTQRHAQRTTGHEGDMATPNMLHLAYIMGGQTDANDYHKSAWTRPQLQALLEAAGLEQIAPWTSEIQDCASLPVSLNLEGVKPGSYKRPVRNITKRIAAVVSMPRLAFTDNMFCPLEAFVPLGIQVHRYTGAFWEQGLTKLIEQLLEQGIEWIFTLDYDTIYTQQDVTRLCQLMAENDNVDAICGVQSKRGVDAPMLRLEDVDGEVQTQVPIEIFGPAMTKCKTAHFGTTLFRASAFTDLPRPWFVGVPNEDGRWLEGRLDPDIYFWKNWEKAGRTLYQANRVKLGHMQLMVTWLDRNFKAIHQRIEDYNEKGKPKECLT